MILTSLEATGLRNIEGASDFCPGLNIFYGDNAQGKTNWLEAIYILGTTKSFRTSQLRECVSFDKDSFIIRGDIQRSTISKKLQVALTGSTKELFINGKRETLLRYIGNLDVFVFSIELLDVIRGDPARRRRYLDRGIVTITPSYLSTLSDYNQVLRQKNRLLALASESENPAHYQGQIDAWNVQLVELGARIYEARVSYVEKLISVLDRNDRGRAIFGAESITVRYRSSFEGKGDLDRFSETFRDRLALRMAAEVAASHSLIGPHRDDLEILADGHEISRFGSAGQQKSALFILDLAQIAIYNSIYEECPVLLIDDIDAELDRGRIEALLSELEGRIQTFISTSRRAIATRYSNRAKVFLVDQGRTKTE